MTTVSKCLVVFAAIASLAFLGFASAVLQGGPNYQSQLEDPLLKDYSFETKTNKKTGKTTYTVKTRLPQVDADGKMAEDVQTLEKDSPVLAKVIIAARTHLKKVQDDERTKIRSEVDGSEVNGRKNPALQDQINRAIKELDEDKVAFRVRKEMLVADLQKIQTEIGKKTLEAQNATTEAERLQTEAKKRREDVYRLKNQLEELTTDIFRAEKQKETLEDLLIRVQGKVQSLKRRSKQLNY